MPVPITHYILARPDGSSTTNVTICDGETFVAFQVYVENVLIIETADLDFTCEIPTNTKVDVLGLDEYEVGGEELNDCNGDDVEFLLPASLVGISLRFFTDRGTGTIDYSTPIFDIDTTGLPTIYAPVDYYHLDDYQFIGLTSCELVNMPATDEPVVRIVFTGRLNSGTYKFAVVSYNASGCESAPLVWTQQVITRPDEIKPQIVSYTPSTDTLVLTAGRNDTGATYKVYVGWWDFDACTIDYTTPIATSTTELITIHGLRGSEANGTLLIGVRETQNGLEEKNFNIIAWTVAASEWVGNQPAAPVNIEAELVGCNEVMITWQYDPTSLPKPTGFHIYQNTLEDLIDVVEYRNKVNAFALVGPISEFTCFYVRAYIEGDEYTDWIESQNDDSYCVSPLPFPIEPSGLEYATWDEIGNYQL